MIDANLIGAIAGIFTTICFIPQAVRVIKAPDTKAISITMYVVFSMGVLLWLIYGIMLNSLPVIIANLFTLPLSLVILVKKIYNVSKKIDS